MILELLKDIPFIFVGLNCISFSIWQTQSDKSKKEVSIPFDNSTELEKWMTRETFCTARAQGNTLISLTPDEYNQTTTATTSVAMVQMIISGLPTLRTWLCAGQRCALVGRMDIRIIPQSPAQPR